jgi:chaperonin GroEL
MTTNVTFNPSEKLMEGVDIIGNAVKSTLGPKGRYVIIEEVHKAPIVTKDGVTVAESIALEDGAQHLAAEIIKQAAKQTVSQAGDGTTTSIVFAQSLIRNANKLIAAGASPTLIRNGVNKMLEHVMKSLFDNSKPIKDNSKEIEHVATISANNDAIIGKLIAEAYSKATLDGVITVKESTINQTYLEEVSGCQFDSGWMSPYFVTDETKFITHQNNPYILIYDGEIKNPNHIMPLLDEIYTQGRSLMIIANEFEKGVLGMLLTNKMRKGLDVVAVQAARHGSHRKKLLEDIAALTGATLVSDENLLRLKDVTLEHLGGAKEVEVSSSATTIIEGKGDQEEIQKRIDAVKAQLELPNTNNLLKEQLKSRLGRLIGGVVILHVGANTQGEMREKLDRIDDSLQATRAAITGGITAGGGTVFIKAAKSCESKLRNFKGDEKLGAALLLNTLEAPLYAIAENAGASPDVVISKVKETPSKGYNALTDKYENLANSGVIDPTLVGASALENAVSAALVLIMTNCTVNFDSDGKYVPDINL